MNTTTRSGTGSGRGGAPGFCPCGAPAVPFAAAQFQGEGAFFLIVATAGPDSRGRVPWRIQILIASRVRWSAGDQRLDGSKQDLISPSPLARNHQSLGGRQVSAPAWRSCEVGAVRRCSEWFWGGMRFKVPLSVERDSFH